MRKIICILIINIIFLFCACGNSSNENYKYQSVDVTTKNEEAQSLYDDGQYENSLDLYLEAMQENTKDINARIGAVKCQIALENYSMALMNLGSAVKVAPQTEELYELYLEISELTNNISTAQTAVNLAKNYNVESFLEKVPEKPILGYESGKYDQRIEVSVESAEETEIYISVNKVDSYNYYNIAYMKPWLMTTGETKLTAFCVKDGVPSETVEATYICEYMPSVVQFEDPVMEQLVRNTINKPEGEITDIDCEQVTTLDNYDLRTDGMDYDIYQAMKFHSLNDLQYFPNLTYLYLYKQSEIEDFSCITLCPLLVQLDLADCGIADIGFISEMPYLSSLYLSDNEVTDINPMIQCENLYYVAVDGNPLNDISELTKLKNLYYLSFNVEQIKDIGMLKQCENLKNLCIYRHDETDLSALGQLTELEGLTIEYDYQENEYYSNRIFITDISYLKNLTNLTYLRISCLEDLSQMDYLKGLKKLQNLYLYNRKNTDAEKDTAIIKELQQALPQCNIQY